MVRTPEQEKKKYYMLHINVMDQTSTSTHFSHWLCYYCYANEGSAPQTAGSLTCVGRGGAQIP